MFSIKPNNGKFDIIGSYLTWTILEMSPDLVEQKRGFSPRDADWDPFKSHLLLGEEQLESFRLAHGKPHEKNHGKKKQNLNGFKWMWVRMEDLGNHRCESSLVLTIQFLGYQILTHTQIVKPHFSHDSGHSYGCTECSYHIIRKRIMILTVTNQNRH